jgi:hypothetical protein
MKKPYVLCACQPWSEAPATVLNFDSFMLKCDVSVTHEDECVCDTHLESKEGILT